MKLMVLKARFAEGTVVENDVNSFNRGLGREKLTYLSPMGFINHYHDESDIA
jgi:hypothetical protein